MDFLCKFHLLCAIVPVSYVRCLPFDDIRWSRLTTSLKYHDHSALLNTFCSFLSWRLDTGSCETYYFGLSVQHLRFRWPWNWKPIVEHRFPYFLSSLDVLSSVFGVIRFFSSPLSQTRHGLQATVVTQSNRMVYVACLPMYQSRLTKPWAFIRI